VPLGLSGESCNVNHSLTAGHQFAAVPQSLRPSPAERAPASAAIFVNKAIRTEEIEMLTKDSIELWGTRRTFADTALLATTTVALMVSLAVAATVVSIGIARADTLGHVAGGDGGPLVLAIFLVFLIAGTGGLTIAAMVRNGRRLRRRD
jgi:hypothetical protein